MSPLPTQMRDRWQNRADTPPGKGIVYWHILMGGYPEVRSLARDIQGQLSGFAGIHMTPLDWLHMSVLVVGNTDEITPTQMQEMVSSASLLLVEASPIRVTLGRVLYHPEAIMLGVEQDGALDPLLDAARTTAKTIANKDGCTTSGTGDWVPHMTLGYSTANQPSQPLIDAIGFDVPVCEVTVNSMSLVVQWGPERLWDWRPVGVARLDGPRDHEE